MAEMSLGRRLRFPPGVFNVSKVGDSRGSSQQQAEAICCGLGTNGSGSKAADIAPSQQRHGAFARLSRQWDLAAGPFAASGRRVPRGRGFLLAGISAAMRTGEEGWSR